MELSEVADVEPPCFDPTCPCCKAWRSLDDYRQAEINRLNAKLPPPQPGDPHIYASIRGGRSHWHGRSENAVMECRFTMKDAESWLVAGALDESW